MTVDRETEIVFGPHRHGIPPLAPYFRAFWERRQFIYFLARTELRARHIDTWFGQVWTILNPLLLGGVYFFLIAVLRGSLSDSAHFAFIISGIFAFFFTRNSIATGAKSIVGGTKVILNTTIPRAVLPASAVVTALLMYLPMLVVYATIHLLAGAPVTVALVMVPVIIAIQTVFNFGMALGFATLTVYFRDVSGFLPYVLRIWLYLSPVLYSLEEVPERFRTFFYFNPLTPLLTAWHQVLADGRMPSAATVVSAAAWATALLVAGAAFFMSREREFAIRV